MRAAKSGTWILLWTNRLAGSPGLVRLLGARALDALDAELRGAATLAVLAADARRGGLFARSAISAARCFLCALLARAARHAGRLVRGDLVSGAARGAHFPSDVELFVELARFARVPLRVGNRSVGAALALLAVRRGSTSPASDAGHALVSDFVHHRARDH